MTHAVSINPADISIRPATDRDEPFLKQVHEAARLWEFEVLLQTGQEELYHKVVAQQYRSQLQSYEADFPQAHYAVIQWTDRPIGRLYLNYREDEVRVLDIGILPEYRGHGIGEIVLKGICIEAGLRRVPVRLHVHYLSRARAFYQSVGFRQTAEVLPHIAMEWLHPDPDALMRGVFDPRQAAPVS